MNFYIYVEEEIRNLRSTDTPRRVRTFFADRNSESCDLWSPFCVLCLVPGVLFEAIVEGGFDIVFVEMLTYEYEFLHSVAISLVPITGYLRLSEQELL